MIPLLTPTPIKLPKKPPTMAPTTGTGMSTCPTMVPVVPPINWQLESHNFRLTVDLNCEFVIKPFYAEIYKENAAPQREHLDQAPVFTLTVRTPQCGYTVWGKTLGSADLLGRNPGTYTSFEGRDSDLL